MTWNEEDHPRDEIGRFTCSGGGSSDDADEADKYSKPQNGVFKLNAEVNKVETEKPVDVLYRGEKVKKVVKKVETAYKEKLLDVLGKLATPADVLYATTKKLEAKIRENGLSHKLERAKTDMLQKAKNAGGFVYQKTAEMLIGKGYSLGHTLGNNIYGKDTMGNLDLAHKKVRNPDYLKDAIELKNFDDKRVASDKEYLVKKLNSQFNNEYTKITNIENIKGYYFKSNSEPSLRISQDKDFRKVIKENKDKILKRQDISMEFPRYKDNIESNLHFAFGHVDIRNGYLDKQGNLHIKMYDTYDFNKQNKTLLNQAGYNQMVKGNLKPYFTIHDIIIPKSEVVNLWN